MFVVRVDTRELDRLSLKIDKFYKGLENPTALWKALDRSLNEYEKALFKNQGFGKWKPYAKTPTGFFSTEVRARNYMEWKERQVPGSSATLLVLTGKMLRSFKSVHSGKRFTFKNTAKYAEVQNSKRPFLMMDRNISRIVKHEAEEFAGKQARVFIK